MGVCLTWSAGKKTLATALGFAFEYTAGGRVRVSKSDFIEHSPEELFGDQYIMLKLNLR